MTSEVLNRIPAVNNWDDSLKDVVGYLELGELQSWDVVELGLEDANIHIVTVLGEYLFKGFATSREQSEIDRYEEIFEIVTAEDIPHPKLVAKNDKLVHKVGNVQFSVYEWVNGKSFYELDRVPTEDELVKIVEIAAHLNKLDVQPEFVEDSWAVYNLPAMYEKLKDDLDDSDHELVKAALEIYQQVDQAALPRAFVHGDITQQNLILGEDGKIYIIDFGVANYYPRIQEIALMAALLMDKDMPIRKRIEVLVKEYERHIELSDIEKDAIFAYVIASQAMEILGTYGARAKGSQLEELDYWIDIGRRGLTQSLSEL